jgi:NitT/TauT family transport system permease protein
MNDQSNGQKLFLTRLRRHRITVLISRVLILTVFLFLWELLLLYLEL